MACINKNKDRQACHGGYVLGDITGEIEDAQEAVRKVDDKCLHG